MDSVVQFEGTIYEGGYGLIARSVMRDRSLHRNSKAIYAYICSFASHGNSGARVAFPSVALQCAELGFSEDTYYKHRKALEKKGYIKIEKARGELGKFDRNLYKICAVPVPVDDEILPSPKNSGMAPDPKNPYPKNPSTEKPSTENSGTKNTSFKNNSLKNNSAKNPNLNHEMDYDNRLGRKNDAYTLQLPMSVRKIIYEMDLFGFGHGKGQGLYESLHPLEIEKFYNTSAYIKPSADRFDSAFINDYEFESVVRAIIETGPRPVKNSMGILKDYVLRRLSYKTENAEYEQAVETVGLPVGRRPSAPLFDWLE